MKRENKKMNEKKLENLWAIPLISSLAVIISFRIITGLNESMFYRGAGLTGIFSAIIIVIILTLLKGGNKKNE